MTPTPVSDKVKMGGGRREVEHDKVLAMFSLRETRKIIHDKKASWKARQRPNPHHEEILAIFETPGSSQNSTITHRFPG